MREVKASERKEKGKKNSKERVIRVF